MAERWVTGPMAGPAGPPPGWRAGDPGERRQSVKASVGVLLCRRSPATGRPEAVLVHKRYTYAFSEFVHGRYSRKNPRAAPALLAQMTVDELLDVYSLDFELMWHRIWLWSEKREQYLKKLAKFQANFLRADGGAALRAAARAAPGQGALLWEFPKGRPNGCESEVMCALRELAEEAGVAKKDYRLLPDVRRRVTFVAQGVRYVQTYYVAVANARFAAAGGPNGGLERGQGALRDLASIGETNAARWAKSSSAPAATAMARRVFPVPPGPTSVRSRTSSRLRITVTSSSPRPRPISGVDGAGRRDA